MVDQIRMRALPGTLTSPSIVTLELEFISGNADRRGDGPRREAPHAFNCRSNNTRPRELENPRGTANQLVCRVERRRRGSRLKNTAPPLRSHQITGRIHGRSGVVGFVLKPFVYQCSNCLKLEMGRVHK